MLITPARTLHCAHHFWQGLNVHVIPTHLWSPRPQEIQQLNLRLNTLELRVAGSEEQGGAIRNEDIAGVSSTVHQVMLFPWKNQRLCSRKSLPRSPPYDANTVVVGFQLRRWWCPIQSPWRVRRKRSSPLQFEQRHNLCCVSRCIKALWKRVEPSSSRWIGRLREDGHGFLLCAVDFQHSHASRFVAKRIRVNNRPVYIVSCCFAVSVEYDISIYCNNIYIYIIAVIYNIYVRSSCRLLLLSWGVRYEPLLRALFCEGEVSLVAGRIVCL